MWKVLGKNDEVTVCECCGRADLKATVILSNGAGEVRYGRVCAARLMGCAAVEVDRGVKAAEVEAVRLRQIEANREQAEYEQWLMTNYGDTRSSMEPRKAWRAALAA